MKEVSLAEIQRYPQGRFALQVATALGEAGYQTFFVGGCIRDILMGLTPRDFDLVTFAPPDVVMEMYTRARFHSERYDIIKVVGVDSETETQCQVEITTVHLAQNGLGQYLRPSSAPKSETQAHSYLRRDARFRDFTINAIYFNPSTERIFDPLQGRDAIERKMLVHASQSVQHRMPARPAEILRAIRFCARFQFTIDEELDQAISRWYWRVSSLPGVVKQKHLSLILEEHSVARGVQLLSDYDLLDDLLPGVVQLKDQDSYAPAADREHGESALEYALAHLARLPRPAPRWLVIAVLHQESTFSHSRASVSAMSFKRARPYLVLQYIEALRQLHSIPPVHPYAQKQALGSGLSSTEVFVGLFAFHAAELRLAHERGIAMENNLERALALKDSNETWIKRWIPWWPEWRLDT